MSFKVGDAVIHNNESPTFIGVIVGFTKLTHKTYGRECIVKEPCGGLFLPWECTLKLRKLTPLEQLL